MNGWMARVGQIKMPEKEREPRWRPGTGDSDEQVWPAAILPGKPWSPLGLRASLGTTWVGAGVGMGTEIRPPGSSSGMIRGKIGMSTVLEEVN